MRINFAPIHHNAAFNKSSPKNYTDRSANMQKLGIKTSDLKPDNASNIEKSVNAFLQNEQNLGQKVELSVSKEVLVEEPETATACVDLKQEPKVSKEILVEYLEAVALADSAKSSHAKIGYVVTAAALAAVAFLAIKCIGLLQENLVLNSHLHNCQNPSDDNPQVIQDFVRYSPDSLPANEGFKYVQLLANNLEFLVREICSNQASDKANSHKLTFAAIPKKFEPSDDNSKLYNNIQIICNEKKITGPSVFDFRYTDANSFKEEVTAYVALTENKKPEKTTFAMHLNRETQHKTPEIKAFNDQEA